MAEPFPVELAVGVAAVIIAALSIFLFMRASRVKVKTEAQATQPTHEEKEATEAISQKPPAATGEGGLQIFQAGRHLPATEIERARSNMRVLTLKRELLSIVLKRLFEAEDEGEISREERVRLSKDYEDEMKRIGDDLRRSELIVTLNELESIREEILKKFEATLNSTQVKIDSILKELKIEEPEKAPPEAEPRRKRMVKKGEKEEVEKGEEAEEAEEEEKPQPPKRAKTEVEEKLEQLRKEVLKELEELDKLEIGV